MTAKLLKTYARRYSKKIKFNKIYFNDFLELSRDKNNQIIVSSASPNIYLKFFEFKYLISTELQFEANKPVGIKFHNYSNNKVKRINELGIDTIDVLYTDSFSDEPLASITKKIIMVKKDKKRIFNSYNEFLKAK